MNIDDTEFQAEARLKMGAWLKQHFPVEIELEALRAENARVLKEVARLRAIVGNIRRCVSCKREVLGDRSDAFRVVGTEGEGTEDGEEDWDI